MEVAITRFVRHDGGGALKAFCDVMVGDHLLIKGIRVIEGRLGPFVSMPRQQNREGKWFDSVIPMTRGMKAELTRAVMDAYRNSEVAAAAGEDSHII